MSNFISAVAPKILGGAFAAELSFGPGLNIICGENGTGKTRLLAVMKSARTPDWQRLAEQNGIRVNGCSFQELRVLAISPKRNAERRNFESAMQELRRQSKNLDSFFASIDQQMIEDTTFTTYPSIAEYFYYEYEALCRDGGNQKEKMGLAVERINQVIRSVLEHLELHALWKDGAPRLTIRKYNCEFPIEALSCGEKEILALILNLYLSRDKYDVFLVDEPEIHLNWHLEERLFTYLKKFCGEFGRQVIVATHSRVIFKKEFLECAMFLRWSDGKITCSKQIEESMRRRIAGDAIEVIKLGESSSGPTFIVEDRTHEMVIRALASGLGVRVTVSAAGNASNVLSLFRYSKSERGWENFFFVIDGDGRGNPYPNEKRVIHLDKYCMENYLLNIRVCCALSGKSEAEIKETILNAIKGNRKAVVGQNKFFGFLFERLTTGDITEESLKELDASAIIEHFVREIGTGDVETHISRFVAYCCEKKLVGECLPKELVEILQVPSAPQPASPTPRTAEAAPAV